MKLTLSKCLDKLDSIIFNNFDNYKDDIQIREILNDIRTYIINSREDNKKYNKRAFVVILEFINFLIEESYDTITHLFNTRIAGLRFLIIKFRDNQLLIRDQQINFEEDCYTFLRDIIDNGHDYGYNRDNEE